jgi:hypothetical protein
MQKYAWQRHDMKCIFGDLNFRNCGAFSAESIWRLIDQGDFMALQMNDEYMQFRKKPAQVRGLLRDYAEGTITFFPTYKFKVKENRYDDKRFPAYTDRILFEQVHEQPQKNPLMNIYYNTAEIFLSDHLPIVGLFEAKIKVVDETKRQAVIADARK